MLGGEKILITGATGKIAFPIARELAAGNEVWGIARLRDQTARDKLVAAGVMPIALDLSADDFSQLPDDFSYVFHAAVDPGLDDWVRSVETNARRSGDLLYHCPEAHTPLRPDVTLMHKVPGRTKVPWREGFRRMIKSRHPEIQLEDST